MELPIDMQSVKVSFESRKKHIFKLVDGVTYRHAISESQLLNLLNAEAVDYFLIITS